MTAAPVQNTTTRLYWVDNNTIYEGAVNQTDGMIMSTNFFMNVSTLQGSTSYKIYSFVVDRDRNYIYWGSFAQGIFATRYNPNNTSEISNKTLLLPPMSTPYSLNVNLLTGKIYWYGNNVSIMQGEIDLLNPVKVQSQKVLVTNVVTNNVIIVNNVAVSNTRGFGALFIDKDGKFVTGTVGSSVAGQRGIYTATINSTSQNITIPRLVGDPFSYNPDTTFVDYANQRLYAVAGGSLYFTPLNVTLF
jgi:hypothetical protein